MNSIFLDTRLYGILSVKGLQPENTRRTQMSGRLSAVANDKTIRPDTLSRKAGRVTQSTRAPERNERTRNTSGLRQALQAVHRMIKS